MNKKTGASRQESSAVSMIKPYLAGLASGLFIAFLVNLLGINPQQLIKRDKNTGSASSQSDAAHNVEKGATKTATKFDFYTVLPEQEVVIAEEAPAAMDANGVAVVAPVAGTTVPPPAVDANKNAPITNLSQPAPNAAAIEKAATEKASSEKTKATANIYLQAGSFRRNEEADRRRAQLLMFGFRASVDSINSNSETWYRVQIGPFASDAEMSVARTKLKANGIETLMTRRK